METRENSSVFDLLIDNETRIELLQIAKWAKLLSIMGLIVGLIIVFAGVVTMILGSTINVFSGMRGAGPLVGIISFVFGLIYLYPSWRLLKYATTMPAALNNNDQVSVNAAFKNLKSCFKFWGILALIFLGFYAILFLVQLFASAVYR